MMEEPTFEEDFDWQSAMHSDELMRQGELEEILMRVACGQTTVDDAVILRGALGLSHARR